jgi:hypothetical protein
MGFDASGTFTRQIDPSSEGSEVWQGDAAAGTKILASRHDSHDQDLANGLSACLLRNGAGVPTANIPWGGLNITNLGNPRPGQDQDAATKYYVDHPDAATTPRNLFGADLNGRLNFTAPSGVNGITWTYADLSWVARGDKAGEGNNRLVLNPSVAPSTANVAAGLADVFVIDEVGHINTSAGRLTHNVSYDGAALRTILPGTGTILTFVGGVFSVSSNDVATITNNYAAFTPRTFFSVSGASGTTVLTLDKSASGKYSYIVGSMAGKIRWRIDLGNNTAEGAERVGSDFVLYSYSNDGLTPFTEMSINRLTHKVTFGGDLSVSNLTDPNLTVGPVAAASRFTMQRPITSGDLIICGGTSITTGSYLQLIGSTHASSANDIALGTNGSSRYLFDYSANQHNWFNNTPAVAMSLTGVGNLTITGQLNVDSIIQSSDTSMILASAAGGTLSFRCNGAASATEEVTVDATGSLILQTKLPAATGGIWAGRGVMGKVGYLGAYGSYHQNFNWNGSTLAAYANASIIGNLSYTVSDYRIKKDITPLGSMWNAVKALKPIRYTQQAYDVWVDDDTPRLGFLAHELQEGIGAGAVLGEKDGPDVQSVNPMAVVAVLAKALQEAMGRIEALEAA